MPFGASAFFILELCSIFRVFFRMLSFCYLTELDELGADTGSLKINLTTLLSLIHSRTRCCVMTYLLRFLHPWHLVLAVTWYESEKLANAITLAYHMSSSIDEVACLLQSQLILISGVPWSMPLSPAEDPDL